MKVIIVALVLLPVLTGCEVFQSSYDYRVEQECRELPTPDERLACSRRADDAQRAERASKRE